MALTPGRPSPLCGSLTHGGGYTAAEIKCFAKSLGLKAVTTPVSSPQSNGMAENLVKILMHDYARLAERPNSQTVMSQRSKWFDDYNSYRSRSALGYLPAKLFRANRTAN